MKQDIIFGLISFLLGTLSTWYGWQKKKNNSLSLENVQKLRFIVVGIFFILFSLLLFFDVIDFQ